MSSFAIREEKGKENYTPNAGMYPYTYMHGIWTAAGGAEPYLFAVQNEQLFHQFILIFPSLYLLLILYCSYRTDQ
jgi:hypothetical protein